MLQSSELVHPIIIKAAQITPDAIGNQIKSYVEIMRCRAKVNGIGGKEYYAASTVNAENDLTFEVRYCKALSSLKPQTTVIEYQGNVYDVKQIDDFMHRHETLKIRAVCKNG